MLKTKSLSSSVSAKSLLKYKLKCLFKFFCIVAGGVFISANPALSNDIFLVKNINVDITKENSEIARSYAMIDAQYKAFLILINRIVKNEDIQTIPELSQSEISYLLKEVVVKKEATSPVRYVATLNVEFEETKIKELLKNLDVSFVQFPSKPYLLLPIFQQNDKIFLFNNNPWAEVWRDNPPISELVPIVNMQFNHNDKNILKDDIINKSTLNLLAKAYKTEGVIIAWINIVDNSSIELTLTKYLDGAIKNHYKQNFLISNDNTKEAMGYVAKKIAKFQDDDWKNKMSVNLSKPNLLVAVAPLNNLTQLNNLLNQIAKIPLVAKFEVKALKQDRAQLNIWHSTDFLSLEDAFNKLSLNLIKLNNDIYGIEDLNYSKNHEFSIPN